MAMSHQVMTESRIDFAAPQWKPLVEFLHLWTTLTIDVRLLDKADRDEHQAFRRAYVRAVLAYVEGLVFGLKQQALANPLAELSSAERALLAEESYELDDRGQARARTAFIKLEANIKFAFAMYAKAADAEYELETGEAGWGLLIESIRVRNRLAHPKALADLHVTDTEKDHAREAFNWFGQQHRNMLKVLMATIFRRNGMSDEQIRSAFTTAPFTF
jgi:hypothetical protein